MYLSVIQFMPGIILMYKFGNHCGIMNRYVFERFHELFRSWHKVLVVLTCLRLQAFQPTIHSVRTFNKEEEHTLRKLKDLLPE